MISEGGPLLVTLTFSPLKAIINGFFWENFGKFWKTMRNFGKNLEHFGNISENFSFFFLESQVQI